MLFVSFRLVKAYEELNDILKNEMDLETTEPYLKAKLVLSEVKSTQLN